MDVTAWSRADGCSDPLDELDKRKTEQSKGICAVLGWKFSVWAGDTFGALHPDARRLTSRLIRKLGAASLSSSPREVAE